MTMINNVTATWANETLAQAEGWQCREGAVYLSTESSGDDDRGTRLDKGQAWPFPSGVTVYYRSVGGSARISREQIA
ncbi:hypothetical protein [Tritonibacter mobilis]|uniref:hypothetical protein n=1 Tax=Tritonibacter mobilis TaxID=379347 RepID=UPI0039A6D1A5